jgi:CubicO group peptidase (beta-lactamase class C family)
MATAAFAQDAARMDQIVQSFVTNNQFMGSVLVSRGSEVLLSKGYGFANLEWQIPNTPSTRFRLASVTKQFTAAAILILEERGKLTTEDPVKKHLPDAPSAWDKVTIFHLLTHTSGIPSAIGVPGDAFALPIASTAENVALVRNKSLEFEPGARFQYSNSGYVLLGYLIERISGQSYEAFLRDNIFNPLGMKDSGYDSNSTLIARRAAGYAPSPNGPVNANFVHMSRAHAAGGLYSTVEDLLRWEQGLFGGKLLSAATLQKMTTAFRNDYAFGLQVRTVNGRKLIDHSGGIQGFNTMLAYYPEEKLTVAVLGNIQGGAPAQITGILARVAHGENVTLLSERKEIALAPQALDRYAGTYQLEPRNNMVVTVNGGRLSGKLGNQAALPFFPESETRFFARAVDAQIEFSGGGADGKPTQLILHQSGRSTRARRLDDAEVQRIADLEAEIANRFKDQTPQPGSEAALRRVLEELRTGQPNYDAMSAEAAATTRQQLAVLQEIVKQSGPIQSMTLSSVAPAGADIYHVKLESGSWECRIMLGPDGKIEVFGVRRIKE